MRHHPSSSSTTPATSSRSSSTTPHRYGKERTVRRMKLLIGEGLITSEEERKPHAPAPHRRARRSPPAHRRYYADQITYHRSVPRSSQWHPRPNTSRHRRRQHVPRARDHRPHPLQHRRHPSTSAPSTTKSTPSWASTASSSPSPASKNISTCLIPKLTKFRRSKSQPRRRRSRPPDPRTPRSHSPRRTGA